MQQENAIAVLQSLASAPRLDVYRLLVREGEAGLVAGEIAERLSQQRPQALAPLQVCVQVNISGEHSKSGCATDEAAALCRAVAQLPRLRLRGLMAIPAPTAPGSDPRAPYRALRELFAGLSGLGLDTLSAGMSDDLEAAIAEGATMVRVGSALFGRRQVV